MTTYAEKLVMLAELRGENRLTVTDAPPPAQRAESEFGAPREWSGGQLLATRLPAAAAESPYAASRNQTRRTARNRARRSARNQTRIGQYRRPRPGGVTWTLLRLAASGDIFDRHDVAEQCERPGAERTIGTLASKLCRDGLAKVVVRGGWWVPPGKGQSIIRLATWRGTPKAKEVWAEAQLLEATK